MLKQKQRKLPSIRRQYRSVVNLDFGLDYSMPTTMVQEAATPNCHEVTFRDKVVEKAYGADIFASTDETPLDGTFMLAKQYVTNTGTEELVVHTTDDIYVYSVDNDEFDSILGEEIEFTGTDDDFFSSIIVNDHYIFSNGVDNPMYYDMANPPVLELPGAENCGCRAMQMIGERLNLYGLPDLPRRVKWTVAGGISTPPAETDWTGPGSGDVDLDSTFGDDIIQTAHKLGNYVILYGKKTIVMQEYVGLVSKPYSFYSRVSGIGTPAVGGVANLGDMHIFLGWDDIYLYKGGTDVQSIGDRVSREIFIIANPEYIHRSFMAYLEEQYEVRLYFPLIGSKYPNCYFTYSLSNQSWSRGSRKYTGFGKYKRVTDAPTWDTVGTETTTWDDMTTRWNDSRYESLSPLNIYGDENGIVYADNELSMNNAGVAIDGWWETKDYVVGDGYRRRTTNWMSLGFEARGDTVQVSYSTDLGENFSAPVEFSLESEWKKYRYDLNVNAPQIRFRFRNYKASQTFAMRELEIGFVEASDRGVE